MKKGSLMTEVLPIIRNTGRQNGRVNALVFQILDNVTLTASQIQLPGKQSARKRKPQDSWKQNI